MLIFIDFEKAFDSLEHWAIINALKRCQVDSRYINLITDSYKDCNMTIKINDTEVTIKQRRGIRQGDTLSPKLFIAALADATRCLNWEDKGLKINGRQVTHFDFADDIGLVAKTLEEAYTMLNDIKTECEKVGLKINMNKTVMMTNIAGPHQIQIDGEYIKTKSEFTYLGHNISFGHNCTAKEVRRRIQLTWAAFGKLRDIFKADYPQHLKTQLYDQCVLPTLTYGSETWPLTKDILNDIAVAQRNMERSMLGLRLQDKIRNNEIRGRTKVADAVTRILRLKHSWAGHIMRADNLTTCTTNWTPREDKRRRGRPATRWDDDLKRALGTTWRRMTTDREEWKTTREAYIRYWTTTAD